MDKSTAGVGVLPALPPPGTTEQPSHSDFSVSPSRPGLPPSSPRRDKAGGYGIQALGGMLVECVRGDFLNVVGFPLNHFCKKLVELYCPPRREDVQRVKHESIPAVDTFEIASDAAQGDEGCGPSRAGVDGHSGQAPAGPQGPDTNGLVENPPPFPSDLLDLIDGFKASKVLV